MAYRCRTCGLSDSSCMCLACFDPDDHEGHDFRVYRCSSGGCCDCGDPLAWRPDGFCKRHRHGDRDRDRDGDRDGEAPSMGDLERGAVETLVRRVVAFAVNVLREVFLVCCRRPPGEQQEEEEEDDDERSTDSHSRRRRRSRRATLPRTGRRRGAFPTIVQVHLERLHQCLAWLQTLATSCLAYRAVVSAALFEPLPSTFDLRFEWQTDADEEEGREEEEGPRLLLPLDVLLRTGVLLPVEICDSLGVLYLKLLFDQEFKQRYTCHFVDAYPYFIELYLQASAEHNDDGVRNLSRFIDRLFCQLFHSTAQLDELQRAFDARQSTQPPPATRPRQRRRRQNASSAMSCVETLMAFLLDKLLALFQGTQRLESVGATSTVRVVDCGRSVFKKRIYARLCSDLRTLLVHPKVAAQILLASLARTTTTDSRVAWTLRRDSVLARLVDVVATLQAMDLQLRHVTQHIEFESQNWTFAFVVDYEMTLLLSAFLGGVPLLFEMVPPPEHDALAAALLRPIKRAIHAWTAATASATTTTNRSGRRATDDGDGGGGSRHAQAQLPRAAAAHAGGVSAGRHERVDASNARRLAAARAAVASRRRRATRRR
ncbi:hypothetical protein PINS_up011095 [Pythium insidiosum]|nr:hypothetical protein PINS_up011095 [Pythium insidiosum]